ncbi:helix-hairpin-helix domain-containing protein [Elusimicrobiota bacterium]
MASLVSADEPSLARVPGIGLRRAKTIKEALERR